MWRMRRTVSRRAPAQRATQPGRPEGITQQVPPAGGGVAIRRGMMMDHELGNITERPPPRGQIESEQLFFPADEEPRLESPDLEEGGPADDRGSRQKAEERITGKVRLVGERALFELSADRILAVLRAHQDSTGHDGHLRVDIEKVSSAAQGSRLPPCVVIAESDITASRPEQPRSSVPLLPGSRPTPVP